MIAGGGGRSGQIPTVLRIIWKARDGQHQRGGGDGRGVFLGEPA